MISVDASGRFRARVKRLGLDQREVFQAMQLCAAAWGQPHLHSGRGIRRLGAGVYECRLTREVRLVFLPAGDRLWFDYAGDQASVRAYWRNRR
jgi:hypothetical protein